MKRFVEIFRVQVGIAEIAVRTTLASLIVALLGDGQTLGEHERMSSQAENIMSAAYFVEILDGCSVVVQ